MPPCCLVCRVQVDSDLVLIVCDKCQGLLLNFIALHLAVGITNGAIDMDKHDYPWVQALRDLDKKLGGITL